MPPPTGTGNHGVWSKFVINPDPTPVVKLKIPKKPGPQKSLQEVAAARATENLRRDKKGKVREQVDTPRGRRLGDDGVPRCPCAAPMLPMPMSMRCTSGHGAMSRLPRPPRRPRPNPVPMRTCCDMESCAHGTHCRTVSMRTIVAHCSRQDKSFDGSALAEKPIRSRMPRGGSGTCPW